MHKIHQDSTGYQREVCAKIEEEIRGSPADRDFHIKGQDDHDMTNGNPSDGLMLSAIIVLYKDTQVRLPCF